MRATSKVIMGATLVMVVCLAIVLGLVLVLLAELYCTLLLRRKRHGLPSDATTSAFHSAAVLTSPVVNHNVSSPQLNHSPSLPLASYYAQGVLQAPRSFLYPAISCREDKVSDAMHRTSQLHHHVLDVRTQESNRSSQQIGLLSVSPSSTSFVEPPRQVRANDVCNEKSCNGGEHLVYISNPIYDNDASRAVRVDTPFETPDSSPSRLETGDSSSGDDDEEEEIAQPCQQPSTSSCPHSLIITTPPLSPMKKLPAEACSVSLRDARSLDTSGSDSASDHNGLSSSSSGSPCTSPSW